MSKVKPKEKKTQNQEGPQNVAEVFALSRDVDLLHPYHMDGDIEMYSEQQMAVRSTLKNDPDILKILAEILQLYVWTDVQGLGKVVLEKDYKHNQRLLALILRPNIEKEELDFIVDADWEHDRLVSGQKYYIDKQKLADALFELVDVWTIGSEKEEYISFSRLLKKKLERSLKIPK